ncbi:MAG: hypothetical protein FD123_2704 [Bacteroidetes bacterium]|nr:MAG: hypothetical protein FD123_2704 [Bacteroidota bacterium]
MRNSFLVLFFAPLLFFSCKKEQPEIPKIAFKSASGLISADAIVAMGDTVYVTILADKTDFDLHLFYVGYAYDGVSLPTTDFQDFASPAEFSHMEKNYRIITRNRPGNERWVFSVNDSEGQIAEKEINLRVQ